MSSLSRWQLAKACANIKCNQRWFEEDNLVDAKIEIQEDIEQNYSGAVVETLHTNKPSIFIVLWYYIMGSK